MINENEIQNIETQSENIRWYVVHTLSGHELKVKKVIDRSIEKKIYGELIKQVLIPVEDIIEFQKGKRKTSQKKLFPGYVLVQMVLNEQTEAFIKSIPGTTGFARSGNEILPLTNEEVETIVRRTEKEKTVQKLSIPFNIGDPVRVIDGPFKDFTGVVSEINKERGKVRVMVSIFGRLTPVDVDLMQVREDKKTT